MRPVPVEVYVICGVAVFLIVVWFVSSIRSHNKMMDLYDRAFQANLNFMDAMMRVPPTPPRSSVSLEKENTSD